MIVLFLLEEFKISLEVSLKCTIIMSHNRPKSWSRSLILGPELESIFFRAGVGVRVWSRKFSNPGVGVPQKTRTPHACFQPLVLNSQSNVTGGGLV